MQQLNSQDDPSPKGDTSLGEDTAVAPDEEKGVKVETFNGDTNLIHHESK